MLDISNPNTLDVMRSLMQNVKRAEDHENGTDAESSNEFWREATAILGDEVAHYAVAIGMGKYDPSSTKMREPEIMAEVMILLKFEHHKSQY